MYSRYSPQLDEQFIPAAFSAEGPHKDTYIPSVEDEAYAAKTSSFPESLLGTGGLTNLLKSNFVKLNIGDLILLLIVMLLFLDEGADDLLIVVAVAFLLVF